MSIAWQDALDQLKTGNQRFFADTPRGLLRDRRRRDELIDGQQPFAVVVTCSDSRVSPELPFDAGLGEIFVIRVAGNVPDPSTLASVEFAVAVLGAKLIVVMGHESCGAVEVALEGTDTGKHLTHLLQYIEPAIVAAEDRSVEAIVRLNGRNTATALMAESDVVRTAVDRDGARIVTAFYALASGLVEFDV